MTTESETLHCPTHGESQTTYVCEHLADNAAQRWHCDYPSQDQPWPDAWCDRCNIEFLKQGAWNEANEGLINIKILCSVCYERQKGESISYLDAASFKQWEDFVSACCAELVTKNDQLWQKFSLASYKRWDWSQDTAELVLSNGWHMAAVAARILGAEGAYRTPTDYGFTYMVLHDVRTL